MDRLENIKKFDEYMNVLNEDLIHGEQKDCDRAFIRSTPVIEFSNGDKVKAIDIVNAVHEATRLLEVNHGRTYAFAESTLNIIYLAHSNKIPTMAVDKHMNLYMNAGFIYHNLKMDPELIGAVIMHEALHALYDHINRSLNWLSAKGKPKTPSNWHDTNLAADVEVNRTLTRIGVIEEDRLINEIHGLYLKTLDRQTGVVPLEMILDNEEYMQKLREMCPPDPDPTKKPPMPESEIETTEEWDKGYKDAWNKIAELIRNHGYKGAWEKLQDAGVVNGVGEIYTNKDTDDIMGLEFLTVKSMEDFINEDLNVKPSDKGKTYKDGFMEAFGKLVSELYNAVYPPEDWDDDDSDGPEPPGGEKLKSKMKKDDLDPIKFPQPKGKKKKGGKSDVPENVITDPSDDEKDDKDKEDGDGNGKGQNEIEKDIDKRTNGGENKITTKQDVEFGGRKGVGGTGSFQEEGLSDEELKNSGYSKEDLEEVNKVRENNKFKNTKAGIEKKIERMKRNLPPGHPIKKTLEAIEIEASKYKNIWKKILKEFMAKHTRRAGKDIPHGRNDWKNKKSIARGEYGIHHQNTSQDPQDVNVYVDVSGSMDVELLEIIAKSLVIYTQEWKYSGINICPWASYSGGVHKVDNFYQKTEPQVTKEILDIIDGGRLNCGGGTSGSAAIASMVDAVVETLSDPKKKKKDDIHVVITDGDFDFGNIENRIKQALKSEINRDDVAEKAPKHTIWMIYDDTGNFSESFKERWNNEIKEGRIIFINSSVVKNNA